MAGEASFAVQLGNAQPSLGSVLENGIQLNERRTERSDALAERQREFEQRNQLAQQEKADRNRIFNLEQIQKAVAQKQYETPNHIIDNQVGQQLGSIRDEAMKYIGEKPEFVAQFIADRVGKVSQWTDLAKQHAQQIEAQTTEFNKTLPNTDLNKVTGLTSQQFKDNFFDKDEKGNYTGLKDPHLIQQNVDYLQPIVNNPNTMAQVTNNTAPLDEFMAKIPKNAFEKDNYVNNKGHVISKKVGGYETPFSQLSTDANGSPIMEAKYLTAPAPLTGEGGQPLKLATPEFKAALNANPAVAASFNKRWEDYKASKGITGLDSHTDEILKDNYLYKYANDNLGHHVKEVEIVKTPAPKITVNVGGSEAIDNNSGKLKEHFENAINNNPQEFIVPVKRTNGTVNYDAKETWGDLGKSELTTPFKATVEVPKTANGVTTVRKEEVPFDKYFVGQTGNGGYKVVGTIYKRKEDGSMTNTVVKQEEIPLRQYAERLVKNTTSVKNRGAVVDDNLKDVQGGQAPTYTYKGKKYTEAQVKDQASKSGMTLAEYKKALNL